jgi:hypothetical protein
MNEPDPHLSVDDAVAEFMTTIKLHLGSAPHECSRPSAETPEQAEARRFKLAETLLRAACPDPRLCTHHRCRRDRLCRHFADLRAVRDGSRKLPPSRRSPGATMARHAIWVFMNGNRVGA